MTVDAPAWWMDPGLPFVGGSLDGQHRPALFEPERDDTYERIVTGEVWRWSDGAYRLAP